MLVAFIKATNPRERTGEHSHEAASGFNEHVWNTVVDHPRIMDAIKRILLRPNQLVRPLGACLGVNLEQLKFLFLVFQQQYQYYKV